jgi:hypothetical protein
MVQDKMVKIHIKGDFKILEKKIKEKTDGFGLFLEQIAQLINGSIQKRVQSRGLGSDLSKMKRYSIPYELFRKKTRRQVSYRDLTFRGKMWQSLTTDRIRPNKVKMFFSGGQNMKALKNEERTPFFSITKMEDRVIEQAIKEYFNKL